MVNKISAGFVGTGILILTENEDGTIYQIFAESIQSILDGWKGSCAFVPSNDARVPFQVRLRFSVFRQLGCCQSCPDCGRWCECNDYGLYD